MAFSFYFLYNFKSESEEIFMEPSLEEIFGSYMSWKLDNQT